MSANKETTLSTRSEVINFLVSWGRIPALAKAMTNEFYNMGPEGDDALWDSDGKMMSGINGDEALDVFDDFMDYNVVVTPEGIWFDGSLSFRPDGTRFGS